MPGGAAERHRVDDPAGALASTDRRLARMIEAASVLLPPGWRVRIVLGEAPGSSLAVNLRLVDLKGRLLPGQARDQTGRLWREYRNLADLVFYVQRVLYPELAGRLAWGGKFTRASGQWDIAHFDLAGWRGRGNYQAPAAEVPEIIAGALKKARAGWLI